MRKLWILIVFVGATAVADTSPGDHSEVKGALAITDAWLESKIDYDRVPGISFGIVLDQDMLFQKGYGFSNLRRKTPADENTIYSICSISKLFTGISVMQLRDQGKLTLRDPVSKHLDYVDLPLVNEMSGPPRIQGMLTHSSGLPRESDFPYWRDKFPFPDREQMIERLSQQKMLYAADSLYQYSNLGMALLGEIVAKASGKGYETYVQEQILDPLNMTDTRPSFPTELHGKQMAIGYTGIGRDQKRKPVKPFDTKAIASAAGFTSSVADLAKFAQWQFRLLASERLNPDEVLHPNTLREMQRVHWVDPDWKATYGLGFSVRKVGESTVVGHGGGCPGYITQFAMVPKHKLAVIALTNAGDGPAFQIAGSALKVVGGALAKIKSPSKTSAIDLSDYAGNYAAGVWGGEAAVRVWGDQLAMIRLPAPEIGDVVKLKHVEGDTFVRLTKEGEERHPVVFERNEEGVVTAMKSHSNRTQKILKSS